MTPDLDIVTPDLFEDVHIRLIWPGMLMIVSLDRARPFLSELGLDPTTVARYQPAVCEFVRDWEIWSHQDDDADLPTVTDYLARELTRLFSRVAAAAGEGALVSLRHVLDVSTAFDQKQPWRDTWSSLLYYRLARNWTPEKIADVYAFSTEGLSTLFSLVTDFAVRNKAIETGIEKADAEPLRDWDDEAYKFYRREDDEASPLLRLMFLLQEVLFDEIWWKIVEALTPAELDELQRWGQVELVTHMRSTPSDRAQLPSSARQRPVTP